MNDKKKTYWKWKSTIIDFDNIKEEKADYGDYWTKKEMIFHYLGCPDDKIHEWYNGGWSCEYNSALSYAKEYGLVENYIDYEDEIYQLQSNWNSLREFVKENGFYERQDIIDAICNPNEDKLIYIDDVLDKMNELEKRYEKQED